MEGLRLSEVAGRLGVRSPSLYSHIDGLDGLHAALRLRGFEELDRHLSGAAAGKAKREAVVAVCHAVRTMAHEEPALYAATVRTSESDEPAIAEASNRALATVTAVLEGYGLAESEIIHAARYLRASVHGFLALEAAGGFGLPVDVDESFDRLVDRLTTGLETW